MPSGASLDPSSGVFTWTPDEGDVGADQVTIRVTDAGGLSDEQTISLVVVRRQQAPPTVQACNGQSATLTGTVGMGTDPGEKSSTYHAFIVPPGTQNITGSLSFALAPVRDLDFYLLDADSNAVQASASVSSPEVISYTLPAPGTYYWQVLAFTNPDTAQYQIDYDLCITPVAGVEEPGAAGLRLAPPAPNPFRLSCAIRFDLPRESDVRLGVFDVSGRLIRTLQNGPMFAGRHVRSWDGATNFGARAPAGVYFYRLDARDHSGIETRTRKAVLLD
jgi:hypothetical protein